MSLIAEHVRLLFLRKKSTLCELIRPCVLIFPKKIFFANTFWVVLNTAPQRTSAHPTAPDLKKPVIQILNIISTIEHILRHLRPFLSSLINISNKNENIHKKNRTLLNTAPY